MANEERPDRLISEESKRAFLQMKERMKEEQMNEQRTDKLDNIGSFVMDVLTLIVPWI